MTRRGGLGDILVEEQLLTREQLDQAKRVAERLGTRLVTVLLEQDLVSETALIEALQRRLELDLFDPAHVPVQLEAIREVPFEEADRYRLLPIQLLQHGAQRVLRVAMADPLDTQVIEDIEYSTGCIVEPLVARPSRLSEAIRHYYRGAAAKASTRPRGSSVNEVTVEAGFERKRPVRQPFLADMDEPSLHTQPVLRAQKLSTPAQRIDALVSVLVRKGVIAQEEYEDQLEAMIDAVLKAGDQER